MSVTAAGHCDLIHFHVESVRAPLTLIFWVLHRAKVQGSSSQSRRPRIANSQRESRLEARARADELETVQDLVVVGRLLAAKLVAPAWGARTENCAARPSVTYRSLTIRRRSHG